MRDSVIAGVVQVLLDRSGHGQVAVDGHVLPRVEKVTIECEAGKLPIATVTLRGVDVTVASEGEVVITTLDWGDMQRQWSEKEGQMEE